MPLKRPPLPEAEIKLLRGWIDQGPKAIAGERPGIAPNQSHWAFIPPKRPVVPRSRSPAGRESDRPLHFGPARTGRVVPHRSRPHDLAVPLEP